MALKLVIKKFWILATKSSDSGNEFISSKFSLCRTTQWEDPRVGITEDVYNDPGDTNGWNQSFQGERNSSTYGHHQDHHRTSWAQQYSMPMQHDVWVSFESKSQFRRIF